MRMTRHTRQRLQTERETPRVHLPLSPAEWDYQINFYYATNVKPPKQPDALAIETVHKGTSSRDMEIRAGQARKDIGRIELYSVLHGFLTEWRRQGDEWVISEQREVPQ